MLQSVKKFIPLPVKQRLRKLILGPGERRDSEAAFQQINALIADRPIKINLETYSACNAKCTFCARRKIKPTQELMSLELFRKLCTEYSSVGGGFMGFSPLIADPLLDPMLINRIKILKSEYPKITPHMFTNLISLPKYSDDDVRLLLASLDHIDVSIGGVNKDDYHLMFGVNQFDKVAKSMERLGQLNRELGSPCILQLHIRTNVKASIEDSPELQVLLNFGFTCNDIIDRFSDWGGMVSDKDMPAGATLIKQNNEDKRTPCFLPMTHMEIMPDGRVLGCGCMDGREETFCGNLKDENLIDIWKGEKFVALRTSFAKSELQSLCKTCAFYHDYEELCSRPKLVNFTPQQNFWKSI